MEKRPLGQSGIEASTVAFGAWAIGGWMWGGTEEKDAIAAIHAAIDSGVNLIDTAAIYGFGLSEEIVGKAIHDRRDKVVLATKCAMVCNTQKGEFKFRSTAYGPSSDGHIAIYTYLGAESIRGEVEESLSRLKTDCIDLYQTHWQDSTTPIEETMSTLLDLKKEGKIRAIGVSNANPDHMDEYRKYGPLDTDQEKYNMLERDLEKEQLPYCHENNVAVLAYSPLAKGLLTGKVGPDREFSEGDHRREDPRFSMENRKRVAELLEKIKPIAEAHNFTFAQLAIAWTIRQPGLTHALCGARNPKQAQENATAGSVQLSDDELKTIRQAVEEYSPPEE